MQNIVQTDYVNKTLPIGVFCFQLSDPVIVLHFLFN